MVAKELCAAKCSATFVSAARDKIRVFIKVISRIIAHRARLADGILNMIRSRSSSGPKRLHQPGRP